MRSQGFGSASARDVLISMTAFDGFKYDGDKGTVELGAGANWAKLYTQMEKVAPKEMSKFGVGLPVRPRCQILPHPPHDTSRRNVP